MQVFPNEAIGRQNFSKLCKNAIFTRYDNPSDTVTKGHLKFCGSRIQLFPSRIPNPNCLHPGSRIRIKKFTYFNQKKTKKWFLSSRKYDPGCSSRIRMLTFYPSRIPDPGVKKTPDPGSATLVGQSWRIRRVRGNLLLEYSPDK
jgi:hypothetical protein